MPPKISVLVLTHNHEAFLAQALDSILMQETTFTYEVVVGEDGSTDRTREIVEDYHRRYPHIIRPIYQAGNVGVGANVRACFQACRGEYLAPLEGDDYWTSPHKLQTLATWLDAHPDYVMCFHDLTVRQEWPDQPATMAPEKRGTGEQVEFTFADFVHAIPAHISTIMFRQVLPVLPEWLFTVYPMDMPLLLLYAEHGRARRLPGAQSVYRRHGGGGWSAASRQRRLQQFIPMYQRLRQHYTGTRFESLLGWSYSKMYLTIADESVKIGDLAEARYFLGQFWAADVGFVTKARLLKNLAGVSWRFAQAFRRAGQARPAKQVLPT